MNALISGTAGKALLVDGESLMSFDVDDPSKLVVRQQSDLPYLFGEGRDLRVIKDSDIRTIATELKSDSSSALALDLALISLDEEIETDIREDALRDLDELLVENELVARLENILYARPLPDGGDLVGALKLCANAHLNEVMGLLQRFEERQSAIAEVSAAWDIIPTKVFGTHDHRAEFQHVAAREGLFRALVLALAKPYQPRIPQPQTEIQARLSTFFLNSRLNPAMNGLRNHRQVMQLWTNAFQLRGETVTLKHEIEEEERENAPRRKRGRRVGIDRQAVLGEVTRRKAIISGAIQRGDFEIVRGLIDDLVRYQLGSGEKKHVAKSLCDLAMEAKELGMFSLQLELTERSISVAPDDGWSWAQHGDALLNMRDLDEALRAYQQADAFGIGVTAKNGRASVLKTKGELDAALVAYNDVISEYPDDVFARNGRAEVLKAKGELNEALAAYSEVISQHPEDRVAVTGRLSILAATGLYDEALAALEDLSTRAPLTLDDWIDYHILGMIRLRTGKTAEAIRIFNEGIKSDPVPSSRDYFSRALGLAWLRGHDFQSAGHALDEVKSPLLQPTANVLRIHAFGAQGNIQRATVAYESLSSAPHLRLNDLTQELHHQFILRKPPRRDEHWIIDREDEIVLLAA